MFGVFVHLAGKKLLERLEKVNPHFVEVTQ